MKHSLLFVFIGIISFSLVVCNSSDQIKPLKEETADFDLTVATEIVKSKEKLIVDLSLKEKITQTEFQQLQNTLEEQFGQHARTILSIFIPYDVDNEMPSEILLTEETFYPTVFHKEVEVTKAVIHKSYYENEIFNETSLRITQDYVGKDENLLDWQREYIYTKNTDDEWELYSFSGVLNFAGEPYNAEYLPLEC
ncbi:hypothetical protein BKP35_04995 [Anaerobacillus arseniciselenatis]|uniref:Uncharacterized protein n=1 Tax=Anaerobacillus arseniciselenatis TaxID=85682 RepID=A0A1S2LS48_9BACI|nr:hypothetical protein [Anaerobacillus arseniciselenatis]OIJ15206.1 hypothetical protein BKP35_04995 [Anaerobacillus arseniciselenatis]